MNTRLLKNDLYKLVRNTYININKYKLEDIQDIKVLSILKTSGNKHEFFRVISELMEVYNKCVNLNKLQ